MTAPSTRVERRVGQRFPYLLPVSIRQTSTEIEAAGFTQDLSSRGVFLFTDAPLVEGSEVELTLQMPSEITLGESMRVRCRGHVLRVARPSISLPSIATCDSKLGIAVRFDGYEYLPESLEGTSTFARVSVLHTTREEDQAVAQSSVRPVLG
jgi:PilZ domain